MSVIKTYAVENPDATGGGIVLNVDGTVEIDQLTNAALQAAVQSDDVTNIVVLTQAEYDAIPVPDPATLYVITD
jgi:hypothetical protein